jgi:hypothetical protein
MSIHPHDRNISRVNRPISRVNRPIEIRKPALQAEGEGVKIG